MLDEPATSYSEASHAFLVKDWERAEQIVEGLLERAGVEQQQDEQAPATQIDAELIRKLWILKITLIASTAASAPRSEKEQQLSDVYTRVNRYYSNINSHDNNGSTSCHPSILVALSLAGLKLEVPHYVRRTLEDYIDSLLYGVTMDDSIILDTSNADLSLSGLAINGTSGRETREGWTKSLHRLARIYAVHLLGKTLGEWEEGRAWIEQQLGEQSEGVRLVSEDNAQVSMAIICHKQIQVEFNVKSRVSWTSWKHSNDIKTTNFKMLLLKKHD